MRKVKLYCIPYAGGSASIYSKWRRTLAAEIDLIPLELAGRGTKCNEPFYENLDEAVNDLYQLVIKEMDKNDKYILFGHSMGSLIAFELYYKLMKGGYREPMHMFVSGGKAPHLERRLIFHNKPLEEFKKHILEYDQSSEMIFQDEELLDFFVPVLRSDFKMVETHQYIDKTHKVGCDITALTGAWDLSLTLEEVNEWKKHGDKDFQLRQFEGGHFFINEHTEQIVTMIHEVVIGARVR